MCRHSTEFKLLDPKTRHMAISFATYKWKQSFICLMAINSINSNPHHYFFFKHTYLHPLKHNTKCTVSNVHLTESTQIYENFIFNILKATAIAAPKQRSEIIIIIIIRIYTIQLYTQRTTFRIEN